MLCIMAFGQKCLASESLASEPEMPFGDHEIKPLFQFVTNILFSFLKMKLTPPVKRSENFCKSNLLPLFGEVKIFHVSKSNLLPLFGGVKIFLSQTYSHHFKISNFRGKVHEDEHFLKQFSVFM